MIDASWILENKSTGIPVLETWNFELVQFANIEKYRVWTTLSWLQEISRRDKIHGQDF